MLSNNQILMARQPIFDLNMKVVAYELLYRNDDAQNFSSILNGDLATCSVLLNSFTSIYEDQTPRRLPAFINLTKELLESNSLPALPPSQVVFEVLENIVVDEKLIASVKRYKDAGYKIALDDFVFTPDWIPLLKIASIVKVDILELGLEKTRELVETLRPYRLTLLAEKIETQEELSACKEMGFKLFQGYFLAKPAMVHGRRLQANETVLMQLISSLNDPDVTFDELAQLTERDPELTIKILKIVNSPANGLTKKVQNIKNALVVLGRDEFKRWVSLLSLQGQSSKPSELRRQILILARLCEEIATQSKALQEKRHSAFLAGLLEHIDAVLDIDKEMLISQISLDDEIEAAILHRENSLGELLKRTEQFTRGEWDDFSAAEAELFQSCYEKAINWCNDTLKSAG